MGWLSKPVPGVKGFTFGEGHPLGLVLKYLPCDR